MRPSTCFLPAFLLGGLAAASPVRLALRSPQTAAQLVLAVVPNSASCAGKGDDCRTADQVAQPLIDAMIQYSVTSPAEIAAIISLIGFESADFQYKHNVYPGRPGQGTSNMQMINFNTMFAKSFPELAPKVGSDPNEILALVTPDQYNFKSGPWFLTTQCSPAVRTALQKGDDAGFQAYMGCVGTDVAGRAEYWNRAKAAFGL